ncbi:MAG: hypothetical protein OEO83_08935 [Alphaproteobacteria bacterium]|nr:hypothetical protein [Alphaproteobacteria bacterium]
MSSVNPQELALSSARAWSSGAHGDDLGIELMEAGRQRLINVEIGVAAPAMQAAVKDENQKAARRRLGNVSFSATDEREFSPPPTSGSSSFGNGRPVLIVIASSLVILSDIPDAQATRRGPRL